MRFPFWMLVSSLAVFGSELRKSENLVDLVYEKKGNVSVVGIIDVADCEAVAVRHLQEMASAIWTIEAVNVYQYLPGVTVGLSLFKTCQGNFGEEHATTQLVRSVSLRAQNSNTIGILSTSAVYRELQRLKAFSKARLVEVKHIIDVDTLVELTVELLTNLQWTIVDGILADSEFVLNSFGGKASNEGIHVRDELLITHRNASSRLSTLDRDNDPDGLFIVIAEFSIIQRALNGIEGKNNVWVVVPSDFNFFPSSDFPENLIVLLPAMEREDTLEEYVNSPKRQRDVYNHREATKSPLFVGVAAGILELLKPLKQVRDKDCRDSKQTCAEVVSFIEGEGGERNKTVLLLPQSMKVSLDDLANDLKALKIEASPSDEMFLYITSLIRGNLTEDVAIFEISNLKTTKGLAPVLLVINDSLLSKLRRTGVENEQTFGSGLENVGRETEPEALLTELPQGSANRSRGNLKKVDAGRNESVQTNDCEPNEVYPICRNFVRNSTHNANGPLVVWRFSTWVSVNTSVGFMVVTCTLSIMFFILGRICKGDVLEGSPYFTLLLMVAVIFLFVFSLPFHFDLAANELICGFRANGPPLAYAFVFSLLLSRSLMLAASEGGNFVSHVNGYLQTILFFFIFAIQVTISLQTWLQGPPQIFNLNSEHEFVIPFFYNFVLLFFLACLGPFIMRSKRNYREGLCFSISIFLMILVWSAWITLYILLPVEHKEAAVGIGLNSTGAVLLFCLFIPRTYLMVAAIVRDRAAHSLPTLDRNILSESCEANFKSSRSLSDSVFGSITFRNSEMGLSNPNFTLGNSSRGNRDNTNDITRESVLNLSQNPPQAK